MALGLGLQKGATSVDNLGISRAHPIEFDTHLQLVDPFIARNSVSLLSASSF